MSWEFKIKIFIKACEIARAAELSKTQVETLQGKRTGNFVKPKNTSRQLNSETRKGPDKSWVGKKYFCKKCHTNPECHKILAFGKICRNCNGSNHFQVRCQQPVKFKNKNVKSFRRLKS